MNLNMDLLNNSGYPLQLGIEQKIRETQSKHEWSVIVHEHRWSNPEMKEEGYIDLIIERWLTYSRLVMVIECKRIEGTWNFLIPYGESGVRSKSCLFNVGKDSGRILWKEYENPPATDQAPFCVPSIQEKKDSRTLEKISNELLLALESFAVQDVSVYKPGTRDGFIYIPVIITTAKLMKMVIKPQDVNLLDGSFKPESSEEIHWIRFRKNLASTVGVDAAQLKDPIQFIQDLNKASDRTILIIQASHFTQYLEAMKTGSFT